MHSEVKPYGTIPSKIKDILKCWARVQRTALIRILSAFRTVATQTLEVECYVTPTRLRLNQRAQNVIANLSSLPHDHPMHEVLERTKRRVKRKKNHPKFPLAEAMRMIDIDQVEDLETIDPRPLEPWRQPVFDKIDIKTDREIAIQNVSHRAIFKYRTRKVVREAYEGRFQPSAKQLASLNRWPILKPGEDGRGAEDDVTTDPSSDDLDSD